ncbi:MAG: hypothetical protein KME64_33920 [Scytonematopsis contorta HA4267-MV1]|jgi:hypothetical protein|nr:hypothetical protein [Scytonematopsis contorta HA4267-MV1]
MNNPEYVNIDSLLLDLFQKLRQAGMALTLEQYELLRQAVNKGYGLGGWKDIKRVCRLLWVKPSANYDARIFDRAFEDYIQQHHAKIPLETEPTPKNIPSIPPDKKTPLNLPKIPPRKSKNAGMPSKKAESEKEVLGAVKTSSTDTSNNFNFTPKDFPINLRDVEVIWRLLKRPVQIGREYELDIDATLELIEREDFSSDVIMRPVRIRRAELLLLIDDNLAMIPYFSAFEPFIQAINEARITPASIYRFTSYPDEFLYYWHDPTKAEVITNLLPKLHQNRTIALIISEAGATIGTYSEQRINGISKFLSILSPCVRQLIWLNPLPSERWQQTSAWEIHKILDGKMLTYEPAGLQALAKENPQGSMIKIWSTYPHP